jgi:hypothetical protein
LGFLSFMYTEKAFNPIVLNIISKGHSVLGGVLLQSEFIGYTHLIVVIRRLHVLCVSVCSVCLKNWRNRSLRISTIRWVYPINSDRLKYIFYEQQSKSGGTLLLRPTLITPCWRWISWPCNWRNINVSHYKLPRSHLAPAGVLSRISLMDILFPLPCHRIDQRLTINDGSASLPILVRDFCSQILSIRIKVKYFMQRL